VQGDDDWYSPHTSGREHGASQQVPALEVDDVRSDLVEHLGDHRFHSGIGVDEAKRAISSTQVETHTVHVFVASALASSRFVHVLDA
jgi:hypothetical protein